MLVVHGSVVIAARVSGPVADRARAYGKIAALLVIVLFALAGAWVAFGLDGYVVTSVQAVDGPSNPLGKTAVAQAGAWLANYHSHGWMLIAPVLGFLGALIAWVGLGQKGLKLALLGSSLSIIGIISTAGLSLFPFLLPSSLDPKSSLTVWDTSSSH